MAKLQLIKPYPKRVTKKDEQGNDLVDQFGRPVTELIDMFLYGLVDYTPEQLELYKTFRTQDGEDYYREEKGVPLFHSSRSYGYEVGLDFYTREDGTVGTSIEDTQVIMLKAALKEVGHLPGMAEMLGAQISMARLTGKRLDLNNINPETGKVDAKKEEGKIDGN